MPRSAAWEPGLGQFFQTWNCILYAAVHDQVCLPFSYLPFKFIFILAAQAFPRGTLCKRQDFLSGSLFSSSIDASFCLSSLQGEPWRWQFSFFCIQIRTFGFMAGAMVI